MENGVAETSMALDSSTEFDEVHEEGTSADTSENLEATWKSLLEFTRHENPILGALLSHGRLLALNDRVIEIGFKKGSFYYERIREEGNKRALEEICRSRFQKDLNLFFSIIGMSAGDSSTVGGQRETDRDRRIRKEVLENPIVKDALEILEGEIEEIKVGSHFES